MGAEVVGTARSRESGTNRLHFIQSKKEEDSDALLQRCYFIYEHQEAWLKAMYPAVYTYCHLDFYRVGDKDRKLPLNRMWAIPQGGDVLRQHTASGVFIDEAAFQPDLEKSIRAAQPMLKGGGRIDCVSSAEPAYFQLLRGYPLRVFSRVGSAASRRRMVEYWPWSAMQKSKGSPGFRKGSQN